jgi:peptidoglycan/LPS O-acetylase OafA/YrhL
MFIPLMRVWAWSNLGIPGSLEPHLAFLFDFTILIGISTLSYRFIEKPALNLKRFFDYKPNRV